MKILIDYDSSWRNSFLNGSNAEPLPNKGRAFIGSMTNLKKEGNFLERSISTDTVMGLLNRLIGDQRKLYQARNKLFAENYYFEDLEEGISFVDKPKLTNEMTYIRNITGSTDQQSFTGVIKSNDPLFTSEYSMEFWGVLGLKLEELYSFILWGHEISLCPKLDPLSLAEHIDLLEKYKKVENVGLVTEVIDFLNLKFPDLTTEKQPAPYIENDGSIKPIRLYAASLYLQYERLSKKYDMGSAMSTRGTISGFSKRGFNGRRDFLTRFTSGKPKSIWGNPYYRKARFNGDDPLQMTKASGQLEIMIDVDRDRGQEIKTLIENAGVSSFYLGKKGLAYVSNIRV